MHLLYLDESGSATDPTQDYFVLAGVSVFERTTHWIEQKLNDVAAPFSPQDPHSIELHGSPMRAGRGPWHKHSLQKRTDTICEALRLGACGFHGKGALLFGAVIRKQALSGSDPVEHAFEQVSNRFDNFLRRLYLKHHDKQRGVVLFDKSSTEERIQSLARTFKYAGHQFGTSKNYAEVPVFLDSRASRLIQLADLVAYALFRNYEHADPTFFNVIKDCFDTEGGVQHGLYIRI
jgi:Protein of unknown function (DUF3800)